MGVIPTDFVYDQAEAIYNEAKIGEVLPNRLRHLLSTAFLWDSTPQGWEYWHDLRFGEREWSVGDSLLFYDWMISYNLLEVTSVPNKPAETEDIQWA